MKNNSPMIILRWGLAFVFFYAALASLTRPDRWMGYVPPYISAAIAPQSFLVIFSLYELVLAGFLFSGRRVKWASCAAAITFAAIVIADFSSMNMVFTSVGLAFASLALFENARSINGATLS